MKQNKAFRAPSISRRNSSKSTLKIKKTFGARVDGPSSIPVNAEYEREYAATLKQSQDYIQSVNNHIAKAIKLVATFNDFVATVKKMDKQREAKREREIAQKAASNDKSLWMESLNTDPGKQKDHAKLCSLLLLQYKTKLDEMFATGHMKKIWELPGSKAHLFSKAYRNTVSYRPNQEGRGEPPMDLGVFTDISEKLRRNINRWKQLNLPAFDSSGPRLAPLARSAAADVDTVGMQIQQMKKWWGHRGVKFNDIDRDTMAFCKAVAPQGAPRYYEKKSTLDTIHEYRFPFKCSGNRFGNNDLTTDEIMLLGESGGGASLAAARRRKGSIAMHGSKQGSNSSLAENKPVTPLSTDTLGVKTDDPMDENDLGLPTDYLRRLKPFERFGTMKSSALKARLKGPSPSFLSKVKRDEPPVYLRKDIYSTVALGIEPKSTFKFDSRQLFGRGPSGRERPGIPFVRMSAKKESRSQIPNTIEEYQRMKQGLPLKRKRYISNSTSSIGVTGGVMEQSNSKIFEGGSALLPSQSAGQLSKNKMSRSSGSAPSIPSKVPGDSQINNSVPATDDDFDNSMMFGDDDGDDDGEDELYAAMAAEASVDAHISFEESTIVDVEALVSGMDSKNIRASRSGSRATLDSGKHSRISTGSAVATQRRGRRHAHVGMQITVRSPAGAYVSLRVTPMTTISEIRELVRTKTGLSSKIRKQLESCAVVIFKKKIVEPTSTLKDIGATNNSTLQALQYW